MEPTGVVAIVGLVMATLNSLGWFVYCGVKVWRNYYYNDSNSSISIDEEITNPDGGSSKRKVNIISNKSTQEDNSGKHSYMSARITPKSTNNEQDTEADSIYPISRARQNTNSAFEIGMNMYNHSIDNDPNFFKDKGKSKSLLNTITVDQEQGLIGSSTGQVEGEENV